MRETLSTRLVEAEKKPNMIFFAESKFLYLLQPHLIGNMMASEVESLVAAHEWCVDHHEELEKYPGKWVAVLEGKIIAVGSTYGETYKKARQKSPDKAPLVTYVPPEGEELLIL